MLDGTISKEDYTIKSSDLAQKILEKEKEIKDIEEGLLNQKRLKDKLEEIKQKVLESDIILVFDSEVFSEVIDRVIVGGIDENGNYNPHLITYVFDMTNKDYKNHNNSDDYLIADTQNIEYSFWTYKLLDNGSRKRIYRDSLPIRVALKCK